MKRKKERKSNIKTLHKENHSKKESLICIFSWCIIFHVCLLIIRYIICYMYLSKVIISNNIIYIAIAAITPYIIWIICTDTVYWQYHYRKRYLFKTVMLNSILTLMQPVYTSIRNLTIEKIITIKINPVLSRGMVLLLIYTLIMTVVSLIFVLLYIIIWPTLNNEVVQRKIALFKISHIVDTRVNKESKYDLDIIKDLETAVNIRIKENDRFVHILVNGSSGTGKTSSVFQPSILCDMKIKIRNAESRQEAYHQMVKSGQACYYGQGNEFDENMIKEINSENGPNKIKRKIVDIKNMYPDCGMTIIAPNASLIEDIIKMSAAHGLCVNVIDPINRYDIYNNSLMVGMNPFFVSFDLPEEERVIQISNAANVFADVLIATNQMGGESDVYFTDIALSVSMNIATAIMLAKNIRREQADILDVQECINNFSKLNEYVSEIEMHYNIKVDTPPPMTKAKLVQQITAESLNTREFGKEEGLIRNRTRHNPYYQQILFIKQELLGPGAEKMYDQARGLRNLINKLLLDPRIKSLLATKDEARLNFDKILSHNKITVVNTAIELGAAISTAFGLFFILTHKVSVLRRKKETRTPHFLWIDEASQYMHPCYEDMIALYRQYRVAVVLAVQSSTQTEKNKATAYLKNVIMGAGTHIVFGRLSPDEMELYSKMAGINRQDVAQKSVTETSLLSSNPSYSTQERYTPTLVNNLEGSDIRLLDFQEISLFTIDNGRVLAGRLGKVFFLKDDAFSPVPIKKFNWESIAKKVNEEDHENTAAKEEKEEKYICNNLDGWDHAVFQELMNEKIVKERAEAKEDDYQESLGDMFTQMMFGTKKKIKIAEDKVSDIDIDLKREEEYLLAMLSQLNQIGESNDE